MLNSTETDRQTSTALTEGLGIEEKHKIATLTGFLYFPFMKLDPAFMR